MPRLSTVAPFGFGEFNPGSLLLVYRDLGCRSCQFYRNVKNPPVPIEARHLVEDIGLRFDSVHGVFGPEHDPSCPDETVRRDAINTYRQEADLACELGGPAVVVHPAPPVPPDEHNDQARARRLDPLRRTLEELAVIGKQRDVMFLIENLPGNYGIGHEPATLAQILRDLNSPHVKMCFDTGHAHMTCDAATALRASLDVVSYLHVHDNDGAHDSHLIPGHGSLHWDRLSPIIAELGPDVPAMLELFDSEATMRDQVIAGLGGKLRRWLAL